MAPWRNEKWFVPPNQCFCLASLVAQQEATCNVGDLDWEDPLEKGVNGYPLQYSGLENSMDCIVCGVAKSQTRLSDFHFHCRACQKALARSPEM